MEVGAQAAVLLAAGWVGEATVLAIEAGTGGVTAMAAGRADRTAEGWDGGTGPGVASNVGMAWARCCAFDDSSCCSPPPAWEGSASTVAITGGATAMCTSALGFTLSRIPNVPLQIRIYNMCKQTLSLEQWAHPAGRGEPAPLTPLSILPVGSLGCAGIRFLRTQLKCKDKRTVL